MAALLPLLSIECRRPWGPIAYCSDAEGLGDDHFGGYGVCYRRVAPEEAAAAGRVAERWRYDVEDYVNARRRDLLVRAGEGLPPLAARGEGAAERPPAAFAPVPASLVGRFSDWT
eukprot:11215119-Lingulodinium_polyedra.AAC.2